MLIDRYIARCPYCKASFAIEGVAPSQRSKADALLLVEAHGRTCEKTEVRLQFRSYGRPEYRAASAYDVMTADWRIQQVRGAFKANVKCNGKCTHAKNGDCECSCGGKNHGSGL